MTEPPKSQSAGVDRSGTWLVALHEALRAHELELNRATAAFEHAVIAPLTLVNGGAAAAWLAFLANRDDVGNLALVAAAWVAGLVLAVAAAYCGWRRQRAYSQSERQRREAFEWLWLGAAEHDTTELLLVLTNEAFKVKYKAEIERVEDAPRRKRRDVAIREAGRPEWLRSRLLASGSTKQASTFSIFFQVLIALSTAAFAVGAIAAGIAL